MMVLFSDKYKKYVPIEMVHSSELLGIVSGRDRRSTGCRLDVINRCVRNHQGLIRNIRRTNTTTLSDVINELYGLCVIGNPLLDQKSILKQKKLSRSEQRPVNLW